MSDSRPTSTRRRALKLAGVSGFSGVSGLTGLSLSSQPALAISGTVSLPSGLTEGAVDVSSYELQYAELDTASDITITYVLRTQSETVNESHTVPITEPTGSVMTGSHSINVPSGEVSMQVQLEHPSVGTVSTQESAPTTVASAIPTSVVDNFNDGDITTLADNWDGWTGSTSYLTASHDISIEGDFVGKFGPLDSSFETVETTRGSAFQPIFFGASIYVPSLSGSSTDAFNWRLRDSGGTLVVIITFRHNGDVEAGGQVVGSWSGGQTYRIRADNIDFTADTYDVELDGSVIATDVAFENSASGIQSIALKNDPHPSEPVYFDDVRME